MKLIVIRVALVLGMLLAVSGSSVVLAAQSLPDSQLYATKEVIEQVLLEMQTGPEGKVARQLSMAQERVREIIRLAEQGTDPGEAIQLRLETHLRLALQQSAQLGEGEMLGCLNWIRSMVQTQLQLLNQARERVGEQAQGPLGQAIQAMEQVQAQVQAGTQDPAEFRLRARTGQLDELVSSNTLAEDALSIGDENKYGPQPEQPGPGQPGGNPECPLDDCEPVGDSNQYGPQPEQPGPGQPGGNPNGTLNECDPVGDSNQYGPQPEQPGPGQPGGNPDCVDCVPVGDQNMNGEPPADPGSGGATGPGGSGGH